MPVILALARRGDSGVLRTRGGCAHHARVDGPCTRRHYTAPLRHFPGKTCGSFALAPSARRYLPVETAGVFPLCASSLGVGLVVDLRPGVDRAKYWGESGGSTGSPSRA